MQGSVDESKAYWMRRALRAEAEAKEARRAVVDAASRVVVRERGRRPVVADAATPAMTLRPGWGWEGGYGW